LPWPKTTWNGLMLRRRLLAEADVAVPDTLAIAGATAGPDDVLDAAVVAWTASRIAAGSAEWLPRSPQLEEGRPRIWF